MISVIPSMHVREGPHHQILIFLWILTGMWNQYLIKALKEWRFASNAIVGSNWVRVCLFSKFFMFEMESEKLKSTRQLLTLGQAVGVRLVFLLHCLLAISRVSDILNKPLFWIYSLFVLFLILEGIHAVFRRDGLEHKWLV